MKETSTDGAGKPQPTKKPSQITGTGAAGQVKKNPTKDDKGDEDDPIA